MNRTLLLGLAVLLGLAGIAISVMDIVRSEPPPPPRTIAFAKVDIPTYTLIEPSMIEERTVPAGEARFAYTFDEAVGKMTTEPIKAGQKIGRGEAKPPKEVRFVEDLGYEITSFSGRFDEFVGGQLKPGVRVNIYGYREGQGKDDPGEVKLVARDVWVVDVRASTGEAAGRPTPTPRAGGGGGGLLGGASIGGRGDVPASIITVAAEPEVVWHIIEALGAGRYQAWVTLAGNRAFTPTPAPAAMLVQPTYTPLPTYTPFPSPTPPVESTPNPDITGVPTPGELPTTGGN